jgi:beta-lactamase class A
MLVAVTTVAVAVILVAVSVVVLPRVGATSAGRVSFALPNATTATSTPSPSSSADADTLGSAQVRSEEAERRRTTLTAALDQLGTTASADFSVAVVDHISGLTYTYGDDQDFETASVVKVEILAALLLEAREDGRTLTDTQRSLADVMIRQSDNDAATALWWTIGDGTGLQKASTAFGLTETDPGDDGWWGLTTTTVSDQVTLLDAIADPAGPLGDSNEYLLGLMGQVVADQDWGVSAAAEPGETTVLKNGWMTRSTQAGRWTVNSIGRITGPGTDVTLAIMTRGHATQDQGVSFVEQIAKLTRSTLAW